jgi:hypothetical protein
MSDHNKQRSAPSLPERVVLSVEEIAAIVERTQTGALNAQEHAKLKTVVDTLAFITAELQTKRTSLQRLRRMLFGASTETTRNLLAEQGSEPSSAPGTDAQECVGAPPAPQRAGQKLKAPGHGRNGAAAYTGTAHETEIYARLGSKSNLQ